MSDFVRSGLALAPEESAYAKLFGTCVLAACADGASDIHIEPTRQGVDIRFRIFGEMMPPWRKLAIAHKLGFLNAVKKATGLAIGTSGKAQDSRCSPEGMATELRVNLLPTLHGEKIVLRLLDSKRDFGLNALGIQSESLNAIKAALAHQNGVVLMSGPTGSGKTTTLYSMLCAIDRKKRNIVTLEDPVEYTIDGINQVKIDGKVSFANALRAVLRQDPDVILIGEIRDEETADLAFKAAATGHLVLSTIHANGAMEVVERLLGLAVRKDSMIDNFRFSAAQRLIGWLCPACSLPIPDEQFASITPHVNGCPGGYRQRHPAGCPLCRDGLIGRLPVIEYAEGPAIKRFIETAESKNSDGHVVKSLQATALELAAKGVVDLMEVMNLG